MSNNFAADYLATAIRRLKYYKDLGEKSLSQLREEEFNYAPNEASNSIAVIIRHLHGNMLSRWTNFLTEDGEKEWRKRDEEFSTAPLQPGEGRRLWEEGWACFLGALEALQPEDLGKTVYIRREPLTVVDAINRQLAHYPYHVGQIVYLARLIRDKDWRSLSIPVGGSTAYNQSAELKDPAKKF